MATEVALFTISDYENRVRDIIPRYVFNRTFGTYGDPEWSTNTNNLAAFSATKLRPRVLVDVSHRNLSTEVLGHKINFPIMVGPAGTHQRFHPEGELAAARAAGTLGTLMGLSTGSSYSIEEVAEAATGPLWFQLYVFRDRELTESLVRRADRAGYTGLLLTVDKVANLGRRPREQENRYTYILEPGRDWINMAGHDLHKSMLSDNFYFGDALESTFTWSHLEWLRSITSMPLIVKGIQTAEDARLCLEYGADALVVSNHGGHGTPSARSTIETLAEVADAVGGRIEVYCDSGIRWGSDVLKALALGAKAVFLGRAIYWGLCVDGEAGVRHVLEILRDELDETMALCGIVDVNKVDRNIVELPTQGRGGDGVVGQLERLASLVERGYLTRQEYETQKARLLN